MPSRFPAQDIIFLRVLLGLLVICTGGVSPAMALGSDFLIRAWQTDDGLPENSVNAIVQTHDGYMWLGTYNGLVRFDGLRFTVFDSGATPGLKSSRVTCLFEDSQHCLWIGHETGGLTRHEQDRFRSVELVPDVGDRAIVAVGENEVGDIWVLVANGALVRVRDDLVLPPPPAFVEGASPICLTREKTGKLSVVRGGEMSIIEDGELRRIQIAAPGTNYVHAIYPSRDGGEWALVENIMFKCVSGRWTGETRPSPVSQRSITTMLETTGGVVAVGTYDEGIFLVYPGGPVKQVCHTNGLSHNWVRSLFEDGEGNLWVGTGNGGLNALLSRKVTLFNSPDQWNGKAVLALCAAEGATMWVGTEGSGLYRLKEDVWTHFGLSEGLSNLFVWSVTQDTQGRVWAGTWGGGLLVQKGNRFERAPGLEDFTLPITALLSGKHGELWVGTTSGLLRYEEGKTNWFGRAQGLHVPDIRAVAEDAQGTVWFGMVGGGLGCLKNGNLTQFRKPDGLPSEFVVSLHVDADGTLWIGTFDAGLCRYKNGRFSTIDLRHGLPDKTICAIENDGLGSFWISSHKGIFRVGKTDLSRCAEGETASINCVLYNKSEGLPTLECSGGFQPAACRSEDGRLWFPSRKGVVSLKPTDLAKNNIAPSVIIEEAMVDGVAATLSFSGEPLVLQPGQGQLEFRFTGLCFSSPDKVRFKYRMQGLETGWVEWGTRRSVNYTHLPPGRYTFQVTACNNDGVWNEDGASLALIVLPQVWQTLWFQVGCGTLAIGGVMSTVFLITRRRMRLKLEKLERQRAIERERARIARDIHDDLGASLTRITMLSDPAQGKAFGQSAANIGVIYQTARNLTRAMDEIVWAVDPKHDNLDSLATYLGKFAQDYLQPVGVRCRLELPLELPPLPLRAEIRHNLFLAFKETLNNIVKHSGGSEVRIALALEPGQFILTVEDNGRGCPGGTGNAISSLDAGRISSGNGLHNMRRRLEEIGGRCEVIGPAGGGTRIRFSYPTQLEPK